MHFNPAGLKIKDGSDRRPVIALFGLGRWLVGAAIGVDDEMDRRPVHFEKVEAQPGLEKGEDFGPRIKPVDVGVGQLTPRLQAMDGQAIHFDGEMAQVPA